MKIDNPWFNKCDGRISTLLYWLAVDKKRVDLYTGEEYLGMANDLKISEEYIMLLKQGNDRYEKLRKLNVSQFKDLYKKNISSGERFDDLVDKLP
jgi:hypothetical protein